MPKQKIAVAAKSLKNLESEVRKKRSIAVSVDCVIFGFDENKLKVLLIRSDVTEFHGKMSLLGDLVHEEEDLDAAAVQVLKRRTGLDNLYLEQVHTFGDVKRHPGGRVITVVYCSLINIQRYKLMVTDNELHWHEVENVTNLAFDHQQIFENCYLWLQKRVQEHPLGFNLLPQKFSLRELQNLYEAILKIKLDRRNFRKKFQLMGLLIDLNEMEKEVNHRPGKLYKFDYSKYNKMEKKWGGIDF